MQSVRLPTRFIMKKLGKTVKVVAGASDSKRITIPKIVSDYANLQAGDIVYVSIDDDKKIIVEPMRLIPR